MTLITIRSARLDELPKLLEFEQGIVQFERPMDPTLKPDPISYYNLEVLMASQFAEVLVAEVNGRLVGSGYADIKSAKPYLGHSHFAHLGFMYVDPDYRGQGINGRIIEALLSWARGKGIVEARLNVYDQNPTAIRAYEKVGFEKHLINMRIDLTKD